MSGASQEMLADCMSAELASRSKATAVALATMACALLMSVFDDAHAQSFSVEGTSGYLSEWHLSGQIAATPQSHGRLLAGVVTMIHAGACSQDGPLEKTAEFSAKIVGARPSARIDGVVIVDKAVCRFGGVFTGRFSGSMDCPDAKGVPVTLTIQD
ncbi:MAG: hypothetical protein JWQ94_4628 [Tardiphaga sp.]|nr:hypothetical protein [Tardiphaga sp.]